ncbi:MAG: TIGR00159 family protein [Chloroflexi bacterium]|nr:TIGR00159 family protein [Chloroflexota bacterium]
MITNLVNDIVFIFERLNWFNLVDLFLVTLVFFILLQLIRDTQAMVLLRGALVIIVLFSLLTSLDVLPAFSWLVSNTLPALLLAVPVIFAPEIRRTLERLGRAGSIIPSGLSSSNIPKTIPAVVAAVGQLSERRHGALIVIQRLDNLDEYVSTGVILNATVSPELLLQVFYPNTPLHDGAVIISGSKIIAAACVMPLSSSGVLAPSPDRKMGLRHRASLGISEVSDAVAVVVSEETGNITVVQGGRMIRRLDLERLENILRVIFSSQEEKKCFAYWVDRIFSISSKNKLDV